MRRNTIVSTILCGLGATLMLPNFASAAQDRVSAVEKGSLLYFSKVELRWDSSGNLVQDTFIALANDATEDVLVQMYFVNGDHAIDCNDGVIYPWEPKCDEDDNNGGGGGNDDDDDHHCCTDEPGWNNVDNEILLTANQPTYWSVARGEGGASVSPFKVLDQDGREDPEDDRYTVLRGFIVAFAVNNSGQQIRWNHLAGTATLINYDDATAWEYNAWAFQVVKTVAHGAPVGTAGEIKMDGLDYSQPFDQLLLIFQAHGANAFSSDVWGWGGNGPGDLDVTGDATVYAEADLTLHLVDADFRQETEGPVTTKASFEVWNENEVKFSGAHRCITCWDQALLDNFSEANHFNVFFLQTDFGKARIDGLQSQICDFDYDLGDELALGEDPRDIVSEAAALLGVEATFLSITCGDSLGEERATAGSNLFGMGVQSATLLWDTTVGEPEESNAPAGFGKTNSVNMMVDQLINSAIKK